VFVASKGDRADVPNVAFFITDANANVDVATTASGAASVRRQYTYVMVLSVGRDANVYGLWTLASAPPADSVYTVNSYLDLSGLLNSPFVNSFVGTSSPRVLWRNEPSAAPAMPGGPGTQNGEGGPTHTHTHTHD